MGNPDLINGNPDPAGLRSKSEGLPYFPYVGGPVEENKDLQINSRQCSVAVTEIPSPLTPYIVDIGLAGTAIGSI